MFRGCQPDYWQITAGTPTVVQLFQLGGTLYFATAVYFDAKLFANNPLRKLFFIFAVLVQAFSNLFIHCHNWGDLNINAEGFKALPYSCVDAFEDMWKWCFVLIVIGVGMCAPKSESAACVVYVSKVRSASINYIVPWPEKGSLEIIFSKTR